MRVTQLCNAGFAIEVGEAMLLVDVPNREQPPFYTLPEAIWQQIEDRQPPYDRVCGLWFTHDHPDHFDREKALRYHQKWPAIPMFLPDLFPAAGKLKMGPFVIRYQRFDHAPIPDPPIHTVAVVTAGEKRLYLSADARLDCRKHLEFLGGTVCDGAIWNPMYLSTPDTRALLEQAAVRNLICHLPERSGDHSGMWKKVEHNLERFGKELSSVTVLESFPAAPQQI